MTTHVKSPVSSSPLPGVPGRLAESLLARVGMMLGRPFGGLPAQPVLDALLLLLRRNHPGVFERLADLGTVRALIDPVDMPACLLFELGPRPRFRLVDRGRGIAEATIRGSFAALLDLMEGRIDGDALFFTRDLSIEGDTEIVVALRNALDGEEIDLAADIAAALGPLGRLVPSVRRWLEDWAMSLENTRTRLLSPATRRLDGLERRLNRLEEGKR